MTVAIDNNTEFCFPLPDKPRAYSWGASDTDRQIFNAGHSRQYTVCLGADIDVSNTTKRHSHKRSSAISHDFSIDGGLDALDAKTAVNKDISDFFHTEKTGVTSTSSGSAADHAPAGFNSSVSPCVGQLSSLGQTPSSLGSPPTLVSPSFDSPLLSDLSDETCSPKTFQFNSNVTSSQSNDMFLKPLPRGNKRHARVKSWAGTVIRLTKFYNSQDRANHRKSVPVRPVIDSSSEKPRLFSSSYVSEDALNKRNSIKYEPEPEPLIDLDLAFESMISHRRSGSAPEAVAKNFKKLGAIENAIEEEEEDEDDDEHSKSYKSFYRASNSGNGSAVSVYSGHSYERSRFRRSKGYTTSSTHISTPGLHAVSPVGTPVLHTAVSASSLMPPPRAPLEGLMSADNKAAFDGKTVNDTKLSETRNGNSKRSKRATNGNIQSFVLSNEMNDRDEPSTPRTEYEDTFHLGGPGYVRYSVESDRYSFSTLGTFSSLAPNSPTRSPCPSPRTAISSFETGPLSHERRNDVASVGFRRRLGSFLDRLSRR